MKVIRYPISTEKAIRQMESDNILVFIVDKKATRQQVKQAIEELYGVKVLNVNTAIDSRSRKKAYVRFSDETPAIDLATQLGLM